jgi:hypothetical protein
MIQLMPDAPLGERRTLVFVGGAGVYACHMQIKEMRL